MSKRNEGLEVYASAGAGARGSDINVEINMANCHGCAMAQPVVNITNYTTINNTTATTTRSESRKATETNNPSLGEVASFASTLIGLLGSL